MQEHVLLVEVAVKRLVGMELSPIIKGNYAEVVKIYQAGIATGMATFETKAPSWEEWDTSHHSFGRIIAIDHNEVLGWAALSPTSKRHVYRGVAEVSVYVSSSTRGHGIGTFLLQSLIRISEENNIWTLQSGIFTNNKASINMHKSCGFRIIGYREKIGQRDGTWYDNVLMERRSKIINP